MNFCDLLTKDVGTPCNFMKIHQEISEIMVKVVVNFRPPSSEYSELVIVFHSTQKGLYLYNNL